MSKATHSIIEMRHRYDELEKAGKVFASTMDGPDDPEYGRILREMTDLENRIVATRPNTMADHEAKLAFIRKTDFITDDGSCETGDLGALVDMILQLDAERIAAAR